VLTARLSRSRMAASRARLGGIPPWCGECDETTRMLGLLAKALAARAGEYSLSETPDRLSDDARTLHPRMLHGRYVVHVASSLAMGSAAIDGERTRPAEGCQLSCLNRPEPRQVAYLRWLKCRTT